MDEQRGELERRLHLNRQRLAAPEYCAPGLFREGGEWPGDWQGRVILALVCLCRALPDERVGLLAQLEAILSALDGETNEDGFFGRCFDERSVNEQQLSGNSWFVRGLCAYLELTGDNAVRRRLKRIAASYLAKLRPFYADYPLVAREDGGVGGHLQEAVCGSWRLSSDVGCAFILLDGITHCREVLGDEALDPVIDQMVEKFAAIDYVGANLQTHAMLSGTRGVLRYYRLTRRPELLELARRNFAVYAERGMTLNYANYNWFGKPKWTEPCAVVDSLLLAMQLYGETQDAAYLRWVNRIFDNAVRPAQRPNGGAGCETCLTASCGELRTHLYEAFFCCTMRLAEGLTCMAEFRAREIAAGEVLVAYYDDFALRGDGYALRMRVEKELCCIRAELDIEGRVNLRLYLPPCEVEVSRPHAVRDGLLRLPQASGKIQVTLRLSRRKEARGDCLVPMAGDWVLLKKSSPAARPGRICDASRLASREEVEALHQYL